MEQSIDTRTAFMELQAARDRYRRFMKTYWDKERNQVMTSQLKTFAIIFKAGIIARMRYDKSLLQAKRKLTLSL